jgi:hypothetical protein
VVTVNDTDRDAGYVPHIKRLLNQLRKCVIEWIQYTFVFLNNWLLAIAALSRVRNGYGQRQDSASQ